MLQSPPEKGNSVPPQVLSGIWKVLDLALFYAPAILKLLASLGLAKTAHARISARRRARQKVKARLAQTLDKDLLDDSTAYV
jgi:hypothetical protein